MKVLKFIGLVTLIAAANINAVELPVGSYTVKVTRSDLSVSTGEIRAVAGRTAYLSSLDQHSFMEKCEQSSEDTTATPGHVTVGYTFDVTPAKAFAHDIHTIRWEITDLVDTKRIKVGNCTIDQPHITGVKFERSLVLKAGSSFTETSGPYEVTIARLK